MSLRDVLIKRHNAESVSQADEGARRRQLGLFRVRDDASPRPVISFQDVYFKRLAHLRRPGRLHYLPPGVVELTAAVA